VGSHNGEWGGGPEERVASSWGSPAGGGRKKKAEKNWQENHHGTLAKVLAQGTVKKKKSKLIGNQATYDQRRCNLRLPLI